MRSEDISARARKLKSIFSAKHTRKLWFSFHFKLERVKKGQSGIRTRGTRITLYTGLANQRLQPLGHLSKAQHQ